MPNSNVYLCLSLCTLFPCLAFAQSQSKANWCRHVSILSRSSKNNTKTTECYIPIRRAAREAVTLRNAIEKEWQWVLDRPETVNGQVLVIDDKTVKILSQKVCLDAGNVTSHPVTHLYDTIGNKAVPVALAGDFQVSPSRGGDIYRSCVENPTTWRNFTFKRYLGDKGGTLAQKSNQFLQVHTGEHEGWGTKLIPFDYSYSSADLENTFRIAMKSAKAGNKDPPNLYEDSIKSGKPVLLNKYPYETGHAMLATNTTPGLHHGLHQDTTIVAWNRLLEAVASLSGRPTPPVLLPEAIKVHDFMDLTVLSVISIITFKMALSSAAAARRTHVMHWEPPRHSENIQHWTLIRRASQHSNMARYKPPSSAQDFSGPSVAFLVAIVTLIQAVLHFRQTTWRYNEFVIVRQGGLMTYGASNSTFWSSDPKNEFAGAIFVIGHWAAFEIVEVGRPGRFEALATIYGLLLLVICFILYRFSTLREHQLDKRLFRLVLTALRAVVQTVVGAFARLIPSGRGFRRFSTYRSTYLNLAYDFAKKYDFKITPDESFSAWWDGVLIPPSRIRPDPDRVNSACEGIKNKDGSESSVQNTDHVSVILQDSTDFEGEDDVKVTEDDVEKAAAFLAADRHGRLHYAQVIALLSCADLLNAADMLRRFGNRPRPREIRGFALLFYVTGILLPEKSDGKNAVKGNEFRTFDVEKDMQTLREDHKNFVMLLAAPPGTWQHENENLSLGGQGFGVLKKRAT